MALQEKYESADLVPEALREHYIEVDNNGVKEYMLENVVGAIGAKERVKSELNALKQKQLDEESDLTKRLSVLEQERQEALDKVQQEKEAKLLETGKFDELLKLEQEKKTNLEASYKKQLEDTNTELQAMRSERVTEKATSIAGRIAAEIGVQGDGGTVGALTDLIMLKRMKKDSDVTLLNSDGGATDMNEADLRKDIENDPYFAHLIAGVKSNGGYGKGGMGGGAVPINPNAAFSDLSPAQRVEYLNRKKG